MKQPSRKQTMTGGILVFLLIAGAYVVGFVGWGSPKQGGGGTDTGTPELTLVQTNVATVTIASGSTGSVAVTFSPPYSSNPVLAIVPQSFSSSGVPTTMTIYSTLGFQSGTDLNWVNMPAADTEIYGDTLGDHRVSLNWVGASTFRFGYNCPVNSNTIGAYLTIQYSTDGGSIWTELSSSQRAVIDSTLCPNGSGFGSTTYTAIPAGAQTTTTLLRIIGHGGGGVGDTPRFSGLWVEWSTVVTGPANNIYTWRACQTTLTCNTQPAASTTGFTLFVNLAYPVASSQSFRFSWTAGLPV